MLTTFDMDEYVYEALRAGAQRLPAEGRAAGAARRRDPRRCAGDALLAPSVTRRVIEEFVRRPPEAVRTGSARDRAS